MNGAELIAAALHAHGVGSVFAVAGASHAFLLDALDRRGLGIVSARHESGAVSAADGYARARRGLGVALSIAEQGIANTVGGLAAAFAANSPVLVLLALPSERLAGTHGVLPRSGLGLLEPVSRHIAIVRSPNALEDELRTALAMALGGRPGPVVLGFPAALVRAPVSAFSAPLGAPWPAEPEATRDAVREAAAWLRDARRPLLVAGAGCYWSDAGEPLRHLHARSGIPVAANGLARGLVPEDWQGSFSWPYAQLAAHEADCVLVAGARLTQRLGFGRPPRFAADARFIQVDLHAGEAHRHRPIDLFMPAGARPALAALGAEFDASGWPEPGHGRWLAAALEPRRAAVDAIADRTTAPLHPLRLGKLLAARLPADSIYVGDGADIQSWMYGCVAIRSTPGFMDHYPLGAMGIGTPLAVGAAVATRELARRAGREAAPTVLVTGDGSLGFHVAELHAAAREQLRLVVIVGNDGAWGTEVHEQREAIGRDLNTRLGALPYEQLAAAFGCMGLRAETEAELEAALERAFAQDGPVLVNAILDPAAGAQLRADPRLRMIVFSDLGAAQPPRAG